MFIFYHYIGRLVKSQYIQGVPVKFHRNKSLFVVFYFNKEEKFILEGNYEGIDFKW